MQSFLPPRWSQPVTYDVIVILRVLISHAFCFSIKVLHHSRQISTILRTSFKFLTKIRKKKQTVTFCLDNLSTILHEKLIHH